MENSKQNKIGAGIITISIIQLVFYVFALIGSIILLIPASQAIMQSVNSTSPEPSKASTIILLIMSILFIISLALILMKKTIGVYIYFLITAANIISSTIMNGFNLLGLVLSLIFPVLMAIFIYKKKEVFGLAK